MSMEMQFPSNHPNHSNPNSSHHASNNASPTTPTAPLLPMFAFVDPFKGSLHRRAHSDVIYRIPSDEDIFLSCDAFPVAPAPCFDELSSEDDFFSTYIDVEKFGEAGENGVPVEGSGSCKRHNDGKGSSSEKNAKTRHRHSYSADGDGGVGEIGGSKKTASPDKLAHLWTVDPKRAKRILANRQSAARSKERKARYILELEQKVQSLQTEATTLSTQLSLFERDTMGLNAENAELKFRMKAMEEQAQMRDAMNEALKQEIERLKMATGEMGHCSDFPQSGARLMQYNMPPSPRNIFQFQQPPVPILAQLSPLCNSQPGIAPRQLHPSHCYPHQEVPRNDPLGRLQALDISNKHSAYGKSEGPSLSASESSSMY